MKFKQKHAKRIKYSFKLTDFLFILLILIFLLVAAASQSAGKHDPMFISRSETFKFVAGETIHLPCEVSNTGKYSYLVRLSLLVLWKFIDIEWMYMIDLKAYVYISMPFILLVYVL